MPRAARMLGDAPMAFVENQGQGKLGTLFVASGSGYAISIGSTGAAMNLMTGSGTQPSASPPATLTVSFAHAQSGVIVAGSETRGTTSYLLGENRSKWLRELRTYRKITETGVYAGVDVVWRGTATSLDFDFVVSPGASISQIAFDISGATAIAIDAKTGGLTLQLGGKTISVGPPVATQPGPDGRANAVPAHYRLTGDRVEVVVPTYDAHRSLTIDPPIDYSTYLGGSKLDQAWGVATDATNNIYVTGSTNSPDFPTVNGYQMTNPYNNSWAFITKMAADGSGPIWSTYLGGTSAGTTFGSKIVLDSMGHAYVVGSTNQADFPTTSGSYMPTGQGGFAVEFSQTDGSTLLAGTYLSASGFANSSGAAAATDGQGNLYVLGDTTATTFETTAGVIQPTYAGDNSTQGNNGDGALLKLSAGLGGKVWATYLGGSGDDDLKAIAVDNASDVYVTGISKSVDYPVVNPYQSSPVGAGGTYNMVISELSASATALVFSTYFSDQSTGAGGDGEAIAVDGSGAVYVGGTGDGTAVSSAREFVSTMPSTDWGAVVLKLNPGGRSVAYYDLVNAGAADYIAVDAAGDVALSGRILPGGWASSTQASLGTYVANNISLVNPWQAEWGGNGTYDIFAAELDSTGSYQTFSTLLGGSGDDFPQGLALDTSGALVMTGYTNSPDFPVTNDSTLNNYYVNPRDVFITRLAPGPVGGSVPASFRYGSTGNPCAPCAARLAGSAVATQYQGDPIDAADGNLTESFSDFDIPGRGPELSLARTYNSLQAGVGGAFGYGWTSDALTQLAVANGTATISQENASQAVFDLSGSSWLPAAPRYLGALTANSDGTWTYTRLGQERLTFDASGRLTAKTDLNGYTLTYAWVNGQLGTITDAAGRTITLTYTGSLITRASDFSGRVVSYAYNDGNGDLTDVVDVGGGHWQFGYDANHRLTTVKDPVCSNTGGCPGVVDDYDASGRVAWQKDALGRQTTFAYSASGPYATTTITDAKGNVTANQYLMGLLLQVTKGY